MDILIEQNIDDWVERHLGPSFSFRKYQKEAIIEIIENIVSSHPNHNYIIEAPTGSGKSIIVMIAAGVLAEYYDLWSYILCSDLFLWDQYAKFIKEHPFMNFGMIKGQTGNYECSLNHEDMRNADCRMANISWANLFNREKACKLGYSCANSCEYVQARKKAIKSPVVLTTYQMFLYHIDVVSITGNGTNQFTNRPVIFCDECHNIPDIVQGKMTPTVRKSDYEKFVKIYRYAVKQNTDLFSKTEYKIVSSYPTESKLENRFNEIFEHFCNTKEIKSKTAEWMNTYNDFLYEFTDVANYILDDIAHRKNSGDPVSKDDIDIFKTVSFFKNYMCHWNDFNTAIKCAGPEYMIKQVTEDKEHNISVTFNCTKEDWMAWNYLLSQANWRIMLSATVGGKAAFEENVGIKTYSEEHESIFKTIPSTFDFTKSPILFFNRYKMSFKEKENSFENLKPIIYNIINTFKGKKGIIQTGNYDLARQLMFYAPSEIQIRMLLYDGSKDKINVIKKHKYSEDTIIVGPTLCEGVDLPDDDCRFIVILKVPYPNMKDILVSEKMKLFPLWYNSKTSNQIIQGIGRGIRNEHDYCTTYILDGCFYSLYVNTKEQYPKELQDRIKIYN